MKRDKVRKNIVVWSARSGSYADRFEGRHYFLLSFGGKARVGVCWEENLASYANERKKNKNKKATVREDS